MQKMALEFGQPLPSPVGPHENDSPENFDTSIINLSKVDEDDTIQKINQAAYIKETGFMNEISEY